MPEVVGMEAGEPSEEEVMTEYGDPMPLMIEGWWWVTIEPRGGWDGGELRWPWVTCKEEPKNTGGRKYCM